MAARCPRQFDRLDICSGQRLPDQRAKAFASQILEDARDENAIVYFDFTTIPENLFRGAFQRAGDRLQARVRLPIPVR